MEIETRRDIARTGRTSQIKIGRTANEPDTGFVAPTAGQEIDLVRAGALSNTPVIHPGPPEGPRREAVATNGAQRGAGSRSNFTGKSVPMGFRARNVERDSTAASFKFNNVVGELRAKLDSGEKLLRPVGAAKYGDDLESVAVWNPYVGTSEDRRRIGIPHYHADWNELSISARLSLAGCPSRTKTVR